MTALFVIVALVIDLGMVRQNRQADKSASDFAAAAGIRSMDDGGGLVHSWKGICAARDFLLANNPELAGMTETHENASGTAVTPDPCTTPPAVACDDSKPSTWGVLTGHSTDGRVRVTISSGYDLTSSGVPEDAAEYSGDNGEGPCDHLAVIIDEREDAYFGGIVGESDYPTTIRSVARLVQGTDGKATAALALLERTSCRALEIEGAHARVHVLGNGKAPGVIHADSDGSTCSSTDRILFVETNGASVPSIVSMQAELADPPATDPLPGQIRSVALLTNPGTESTLVASDPKEKVCAQEKLADCATKTPPSGGLPTSNTLVGRTKVDQRYLSRIRAIQQDANGYFGWSAADAIAAGGVGDAVYSDSHPDPLFRCGAMPATVPETNVWTDCTDVASVDRSFTGVGRIVIAADLTNNNRNVTFPNAFRVFIKGTVTSAGELHVNHGSSSSCADRYTSQPTVRTEMVVGGSLITTGGTLRMCQTSLLMSNNADSSCPLPLAAGTAPVSNSCIGKIDTTGQSIVDWSAPNANNATSPSPIELANLEDLAFWTETSDGLRIEGQGEVTMAGIFFTPNAAPFRIAGTDDASGNSKFNLLDAQFLTRRLQVGGRGTLRLSPDPQNAVQLELLGGFTLVR